MKKQIKKIINKKVAIHITTQSQFQELYEIAVELKICPLDYVYDKHIKRGDFCITFGKYGCKWCEYEWYSKKGYKIIEFNDLCKDEVIVIYRKDNEVVALDKRTGKKAVAKCHPDEKFNFETGAKLAFERLANDVTFKILALKDHTPHPKMIKGKIYEFINGVTTWDDGCKSKKYANYNDFIVSNCCYDNIVVELKDGDDPKEILKKYENDIKIGDSVEVINTYEVYRNYDHWRGLRGYTSHFVNKKSPSKDKTYKVLNVDKHDGFLDLTLALIQDPDTTQVFIIGIEGLKKC